LAALELEHYPGMAEEEIGRVAAEALGRWPLQGVTVIHRFGKVSPGDGIVLVVTASAHRVAAFEAASFLMDFLKTRAPFWKKEHATDGTTGGWVDAREADDAATERWTRV
jgi:molybdopterin synthase catalytic subunit